MPSQYVTRVEGAIAVLLTADVDAIPARFVPVLGLNGKVAIADPAMARAIITVITAIRCLFLTDPARSMVEYHVTH